MIPRQPPRSLRRPSRGSTRRASMIALTACTVTSVVCGISRSWTSPWSLRRALMLGEWDLIAVTIANVGFGVARNLTGRGYGPVTSEGAEVIRGRPRSKPAGRDLDPARNNAGRAVPIKVRVSYLDDVGTQTAPPAARGGYRTPCRVSVKQQATTSSGNRRVTMARFATCPYCEGSAKGEAQNSAGQCADQESAEPATPRARRSGGAR